MKQRLLIAATLFVLIVSCAPFSRQVMQEVQKDIALGEVIKAPESFKGETVLWGGLVVETIAQKDDTLMIVRQADLDFQKRPRDPDRSAGRFLIRYQGFLDPAIYSKGREVTVVGTIDGQEKRPVGEYQYTYPLINARALHLWERWEDVPLQYDPWYWWDPFYYPARYYPRYRPWYYR